MQEIVSSLSCLLLARNRGMGHYSDACKDCYGAPFFIPCQTELGQVLAIYRSHRHSAHLQPLMKPCAFALDLPTLHRDFQGMHGCNFWVHRYTLHFSTKLIVNVAQKVVALPFIRLTWYAVQPKAWCDAQCGENVEHSRGMGFANKLRYMSEYINTSCVGYIYI